LKKIRDFDILLGKLEIQEINWKLIFLICNRKFKLIHVISRDNFIIKIKYLKLICLECQIFWQKHTITHSQYWGPAPEATLLLWKLIKESASYLPLRLWILSPSFAAMVGFAISRYTLPSKQNRKMRCYIFGVSPLFQTLIR
jgi:hypothetical protein